MEAEVIGPAFMPGTTWQKHNRASALTKRTEDKLWVR